MLSTIVLSALSPAAPGTIVSGSGITATGLDAFSEITVLMTLQGATGGTLNVTLQTSNDGGTSWQDWFRSADILAAAAASTTVVSRPSVVAAPVVIGQGLTPALAKGTVRPGVVGRWMRVVFEAGAGMSAGAAQIITLVGERASG